MKLKTKTITLVAVMSAISTVIYLVLPEIPLVPGVEYLKMDFSDIPAIIAGITGGPIGGILVEVIKNILHLFRSTTLGIGEIINIGIGSSIVICIVQFSKLLSKVMNKKYMSISVYYISAINTIGISIIVGWILNALLTPLFYSLMGFPITTESVLAGVWGSTLLNAVKVSLNLIPFYPVYFALEKAYNKIYH